MSLAEFGYRQLSGLLGAFAPRILASRTRAGKEDPARLNERLAVDLPSRPEGALVWLHGASVGESQVGLMLAERLAAERADLSFLFTSQTLTSASLIARRIDTGPLTSRALHQMAAVDSPKIAARFIDHWQPDMGIFVEGEIWPNLLAELFSTGANIALVNARMTEKSLASWTHHEKFGRSVFHCFDLVLAADARTAVGLAPLVDGDIIEPGNLKLAAPPPPADEDMLNALQQELGERKVWLAASTHPGEEDLAIDAHLRSGGDSLLIIAPRHPERGDSLSAALISRGIRLAQRSRDEVPDANTQVYLADTLGEIGLWTRLSCGVYLGGGHAPGLGGHNPIEIAKLDRPIASGPIVFNFERVFEELTSAGAVELVEDAEALAREVARWLSGDVPPPDLTEWKASLDAPLDRTLSELRKFLPPVGGKDRE